MTSLKLNHIKVKTRDLKIGMFVADVGRSWLRHPWKTKSKLITSVDEIKELLAHDIQEVVVDLSQCSKSVLRTDGILGLSSQEVSQALSIAPQEVSKQITRNMMISPPAKNIDQSRPKRLDQPRTDVSLQDELPKARQTYAQALSVTKEFMNDLRSGKKIEIEKVQDAIEDMIDSVFRNQGAISALLKLKNYDEYTFTHCLNVATLAISIGRQIPLTRQQLLDLGLGAIFHDIGKVRIPEEILNKPARLTDSEFTVMKTHPALGKEILQEQHPGLSSIIYRMVRHHHERSDGSGYPDGIPDSDIDPFVTVCGLCDVYDALSSDRVYHKGMLPHEALKVIFSLRGKHFSPTWTDRFVQSIGIYPPATVIKLNTGAVGVVMLVNTQALLKPEILVIKDQKDRFLALPKHIDMNLSQHADLSITAVVDPKRHGVDPSKYFGV
ncbi:MAG: HD-GYP domain-containing protein [Deltaproteobacteria bacterium]|nr:HD-GYP domain-containing protein [Deltaproteobacteria bacterium]